MPKMKTRKAAASRYKVTGSGKIVIKKQGLRHILTKKSAKRKRRLRKGSVVDKVEFARARQMMPYS